MSAKLVIGLVGEKGSGKGTFAKILQQIAPQASISYVRFSDILVETLNLWSLPLTRSNYQQLAISMEKTFGSGTMAKVTKKRIKNLSTDVVIIDGIRRWPEAKLIRSFPNNLIIYVTAEVKSRYRNLENKSDKEKEAGLSFDQFMKEEQVESEILIPEIGAKADIKITNDRTLKHLQTKAEQFYQVKVKPLLGP